jgi:hypothetical protein
MAKILKIEESKVLVGLDDSSIVEVDKSNFGFEIKEGDNVKYFTNGNDVFITEEKVDVVTKKVVKTFNKKYLIWGGIILGVVLLLMTLKSPEQQAYDKAIVQLKQEYNVKSVSSFKESKVWSYNDEDGKGTYVEGFMEAENKAGTYTTFPFTCLVKNNVVDYCD